MIDLQEPVTMSYSEEESRELRGRFLITLHGFLLLYLSLHNFLLPATLNVLRGAPFFEDVHFWFLFQLPIQYFLRKEKIIPQGYLLFLIVGSLTRLTWELGHATELRSWPVLSVLLSEFSSLIFLSLTVSQFRNRQFLYIPPMALFIVPMLSTFELHSPDAYFTKFSTPTRLSTDDRALGCQGSAVTLEFPFVENYPEVTRLTLRECGFPTPVLRWSSALSLTHQQKAPLNLRLYELSALHGKVRWKFQRLLQLKPGELWDLSPLLKADRIYLLKSPERRHLGLLVLIPTSFEGFILGPGRLTLGFETLSWSPHGS